MNRRRFFGALVGLACAPVAAVPINTLKVMGCDVTTKGMECQCVSVTTLAAECAQQGQHWRDVIAERNREFLYRERIGLHVDSAEAR